MRLAVWGGGERGSQRVTLHHLAQFTLVSGRRGGKEGWVLVPANGCCAADT